MPIYASGTLNTTALVVPNLYVQVLAPQVALLNGVPSNILGVVGTATWGPTNQPLTVASFADQVRQFGYPQLRKYDMSTAVAMAIFQGANNIRCVRVSDGTDTAASASIGSSNLTLTAKYTGTLGNQIQATLATGTAATTWRITLNIPGQIQEVFDNIASGIASATVTAGTGYTSVPSATVTAPNIASGPQQQAIVSASLAITGTPTVSAGGAGYAVNDKITLANGVILNVASVSAGAVATVTVMSAGQLTGGAVPTNPNAQVSTTGSGTGASFTLAWGLGPLVISVPGQGYSSATVTLSGGGGTGGSYAIVCSYWGNMAVAINNDTSGIRAPSNIVVASGPTGTTAPTAAPPVTLSGGTDGAGAVNGASLVGVDTTPRRGMYALRGTGCSIGMLADCDDWTQATYQVAYGQSEGTYMVGVTPSGDTITNAIAQKSSYGIDSYAYKVMFGDWLIWNDPYNNVQRTISPQGAAAGLLSNLSVQNASLNKTLYGFQGTQRQLTGAPYSQAELSQLIGAGIDVIVNPAVAGNIFACASGHNSSSNAVIQSDQYTRLTNYVAATFNAGLGSYVGKLNTADTWRQALTTVNAFLQSMQDQKQIVTFTAVMDATNNPQNRVALGYGQMDVRVQYPGILEKFLLNVEGGASVQIVRQTQALAA